MRSARAILIDGNATSGPANRAILQAKGYEVTLVGDLAAAAAAARSTPTEVIYVQAESGQDLRVLRQAQRRRDVAARALDGALRRLARAQAKADAIGGGAPSER